MCVILRVEVGGYVDIRMIAKQVVIEKGGIAKAADSISEEQLIAVLILKEIVCVESALFHYGYSNFAPRKYKVFTHEQIG